MNMIIAVAAGGALGSVLRYLIGMTVQNITVSQFPWGTLSVNILGSFLMGAVVTYMALAWNPSAEVKAFLTVGLLGGFTTFSAFSLDVITLWERGAPMVVMGYVMGSILLSLFAIILGVMVTRMFFT